MATIIRDRKQADGHVIMTKAGYVRWLKQHENTVVGRTRDFCGNSPIMNYAQSLGFEFGHQSFPAWARKLNEAYENANLGGSVRGSQAIDQVMDVLGYNVYILFYAQGE